MNLIVQQTLVRAREKSAPALTTPLQANPQLPERVITNPINHFLKLAGKRYAENFV